MVGAWPGRNIGMLHHVQPRSELGFIVVFGGAFALEGQKRIQDYFPIKIQLGLQGLENDK